MQDQIRQRVDIYLSIWNRCITASCPKTCFLNASCKGSKRWFNQFPSVPSSGPTLEGVGRCFGCERGVDLFRVCQWPEPEIHVSFRFLLVPLPSFWPFLLRLRHTNKNQQHLFGFFPGKFLSAQFRPRRNLQPDFAWQTYEHFCSPVQRQVDPWMPAEWAFVTLRARDSWKIPWLSKVNLWRIWKSFKLVVFFFGGNLLQMLDVTFVSFI